MLDNLHTAFGDFRRTWVQLLIVGLLTSALGVIVATPLFGGLLSLFLLTADDHVLTDTGIAAFVASPLGVFAVVLIGTIWLGIFLAEMSLGIVIGFGAAEDRRVTYLDALRYVLGKRRRCVELALRFLGVVLLVVLPLLAALGGVYLLLLSDHDINFYLARRPPEFVRAVWIGAGLVLAFGLVLLRIVTSWVLALPIVLFEHESTRDAVAQSRRLAALHRGRIFALLAGWGAAAFAVSTSASWLVGRVGGWLFSLVEFNWIMVVVSLALVLVVASLTSIVIRFAADALLPLGIARLYRSVTADGALTPEISAAGSLVDDGRWDLPGKRLIAGACIGALIVLVGAWSTAQGADGGEFAQIIAHRGASDAAPDNTMAAFERAVEEGTDWIELDVQEDADGVVIVAHDRDFMKQAALPLLVADATADDLKDVDIGTWFDPSFSDQRVLTLRDVLSWAKGRVKIVIELKYYGRNVRLEERVATIVEETDMRDDVRIMSLSREGLRRFSEVRPDWSRGLLNTASLGDLTRLDVDFLALNAAAVSAEQIERAHRRGMDVYVWTINDPVQMWTVLSRGVDGVITNEPALARDVMELRESMGPVARFVIWMSAETGLLAPREAVSVASDA